MDTVFAILVLGAVIFFGALISVGNERQRKAIDGIREQTAQWAMQDLRLKREKMAREVKVDDPVAWLNQTVATVYGENLDLTVSEIFDHPQTLICTRKDGQRIIFTPCSLDDINRIKREGKGRLYGVGIANPLMMLPRSVKHENISILNAGIFFDIELQVAWKAITGMEILQPDRLIMILI